MTIEFNARSDFAAILDGWEPVTLVRRVGAGTVAVPKAWRYSSRTEPMDAGVADVARHDVEWQFPWDNEEEPPQLGDEIVDGASASWTILSVIEHGAKSRLRCLGRNLAVANGLDNVVDILEAVWEEGGSGPEIVGWTTLESDVPARIQPDRTTVDNESALPASTTTFRVLLAAQLALDHNHRIVGPDSTVYQILEFTQAERIDTLPVAKVEKVAAT